MKLFRLGYIYYITSYMINHVIIWFYDIIITFFLNANSDEYINIWDYNFVDRKKTS